MSLAQGFGWNHNDWNFTGYSLAGITTSIYCKNAGICFDVGQGLPFQIGAKHVLVTHGHLDHAAGIPYLISQKNMIGQKNVPFYLPPGLVDPLERILKIWQEVDQHQYSFRLQAVQPGELVELDKLYCIKAFATPHRVPSQGYLVYQKKKRLKEALRNAGEAAILNARRAGEDPNETYLDPMVAFTGDTKIEFLDADPDIARARILFVEATFWDEAKPVEHARQWGHSHIDEIVGILPRLQNERVVLIHASVRYSTAQLQKILQQKLPENERERVVIFPRPS